VLDDQIGFLLRQVSQRHAALFSAAMGAELMTTRWAALSKLAEAGPLSQNRLGRMTAMDAATIKGVIDRLLRRSLVSTTADPTDGRRLLVNLTEAGRSLAMALVPQAEAVTRDTLAPLDATEQHQLKALLRRLR